MNLLKSFKDFGSEHGSTMCVIGALVGLGFTVYETWQARPKVDKIMDEYREKAQEIAESDMEPEEKKKANKDNTIHTAKRVGIAVLPVVGSVVGTATLNVSGHMIDAAKIHNLSTAVTMGDLAYQKLESKTRELIGDDKTQEIKKQIAEEDIKKQFGTNNLDDVDLDTSCILKGAGGNDIFYDAMLGRLFKSDEDTITKAALACALKISSGKEMYLTYNEFCVYELNLPWVPAAEEIGCGRSNLNSYTFVPNMSNCILVGKTPVRVLDWVERPNTHFK